MDELFYKINVFFIGDKILIHEIERVKQVKEIIKVIRNIDYYLILKV